jgi:hypothetical protein
MLHYYYFKLVQTVFLAKENYYNYHAVAVAAIRDVSQVVLHTVTAECRKNRGHVHVVRT